MRHLVTGAGSGIGAAVADLLHARGDDLVLLARNESRAGHLGDRYAGAVVLVADLADPASVERLDLTGVERLDSVVQAAGVVDLGPVAETDLATWQHQLDVNLTSPAVLTRRLLPAVRAGRGTFVFVNSGAGLVAHPEWSAYAATKFGLRALADSLRAEEAAAGVRVTSVFPGRTATPMQQRVHEQEGRDYDAADWTSAATVAATIVHVLDTPADATLSDVTVRPGPGR